MGFKDKIFAVVDLETTGSSYKNGDRIIQIGMTFVQNNTIIQEYDFKVNPGKKIPSMIENLTGISNKDVKNAPYFEDIADYVFNLLEGCVFVAHNIEFDYRFLSKSFIEAGLPELNILGLDTVELVKILFPTLDSYRLSDLSNQFNFAHDKVHDAAGDARATAELFIFLQERAVSLPIVTLEKLNQLSHQTQRNNQDFFEMCLEISREQRVPLSEDIIIVSGIALRKKEILVEQTGHRMKDSFDTRNLWRTATEGTAFKTREGQLDMMNQIEAFFQDSDRHSFAIEAPAGFGKTLAYLFPVILQASPESKVVISTSTLLLQEQLETVMKKVQMMLPFSLLFSQLSSRNHLINLEKVEKIKIFELFGTDALIMMSIYVWLTETETGNLSELSSSHKIGSLIESLSYKFEENEIDSKWREFDFFFFHQEKARKASILLTNHAYLSHHMQDIKGMSENGDISLVVDEAHRFAQMYKEKEKVTFQLSAIRRKVYKFSSVVRGYREHLEQHAKTAFPHYELINLEFAMDQLINTIMELETKFENEFLDEKETQKNTDSYYLSSEFLESNWFKRYARKLILHYEELRLTGARYLELDHHAGEGQFASRLRIFIGAMSEHIHNFSEIMKKDHFGYYAIKKGNRLGGDRIGLEKNHWDIGEKLQKELNATFSKMLYISATLLLTDETNYFSRKIGIEDLETISYTSKYEDVKSKLDIYVPNDIPAVTKMGHHDWTNMLTNFIFQLVSETNKKILVLFNSNQVLEEVLNKLRVRDERGKTGIEFLAQGFSGSQRRVHRRFLEAEQAVLLGSGSYWEGVDFPDQPVEIVVMTRLPFDPPETPENRAIDTYYRDFGGGNSFRTESLPKMIMRLIQGMGRISRKEGHSGILYCLDNRLLYSPYAKKIKDSLPEGITIHEKNFEDLIF
ncbi:helicase C-terminal domain-containing protein [Jeotgalibaca sp. A127]|uniref:helicase C-terminal domain-containing protein n=1 Tax=Jeotgalibaca sp. A127 TaxID=3457324 RepID=UPI003FD2DFE8